MMSAFFWIYLLLLENWPSHGRGYEIVCQLSVQEQGHCREAARKLQCLQLMDDPNRYLAR